MKKSVAIIIGLAIILGAVAAYFFFRSTPAAPVAINPVTGLPFGSGDGMDQLTASSSQLTGGTGTNTNNGTLPKLFQITADPVAGAVSILKNNTEIVRYANRADGHIYDANLSTLAKTEILNTTMPKIYQAIWSSDGSKVIYRTLPGDGDAVSNLELALTAPKQVAVSSSTPLAGPSLFTAASIVVRGAIGDMSPTADGKLALASADRKAIMLSEFDGSKLASLYASNFTDWRIMGGSKTTVLAATKASAGASGFAYAVSRASGSLSKVLGPLQGLVAEPNADLSRVAFSTSDGANTVLSAMVVKTAATETLAPATLAEKCVWSVRMANILYCAAPTLGVGAGEPDLWYQGTAHFSDRIWKFNTDTGAATLLADPKGNINKDIDTENLSLSPDEDYLIFMNKTDLSLWALKLE